ncbi:hypothetical protein K445DRAFT_259840 [Daldinia sp. EC12]|nr:hypothetical protein F4774DRAFT_422851 [Daldinia eschscholtzii]OTB10099.1 hypothetical protein K445DRAFT_259840 [Daldinia sp. EC12]
MQVGYLVPEYTWEELQENHVAVHDWVFNISSLEQEDPSLFHTLQKYTRQDTTAAVTRHDSAAAALIKLFLDNKDLIVAGLTRKRLLDIPRWEFLQYNDYESPQGAWVAVDGYIYNVGHLMKHPEYYEHQIGFNWAARELTDPNLAQWLTTNFPARCIGRLVEGPIPPQPKAEPDFEPEGSDFLSEIEDIMI